MLLIAALTLFTAHVKKQVNMYLQKEAEREWREAAPTNMHERTYLCLHACLNAYIDVRMHAIMYIFM